MNNHAFSIFTDQNYIDCTLFQFGWTCCAPNHSFGPAARNHYLFHYIISGKGLLISRNSKNEDIEYRLHAGQGFLISPQQCNTYIADERTPWEYAWVEFDGLKAQEFMTLAGLNTDTPIYNSSQPEMQERLKEEILYIAQNGSESSVNLIAHLYLFFDALLKSSQNRMTPTHGNLKDFYVREAVSFIERNYQQDISVEDLASYCNLNRSYFGKLFKDVTSATPQEFLIRFRLTKACEYLETTNFSIGEVAMKTGYPNQLHFSQAFKKAYGVSPRQWQKSHMHK